MDCADQTTSLTDLPPELLAHVLSALPSITDVVQAANTCTIFRTPDAQVGTPSPLEQALIMRAEARGPQMSLPAEWGSKQRTDYLTDLERENFFWVIPGFSKLPPERVLSGAFAGGTSKEVFHEWRLMLFARGNFGRSLRNAPSGNGVVPDTHLSIYLQPADSASSAGCIFRDATFDITLHNLDDPRLSVTKQASRHFAVQRRNWDSEVSWNPTDWGYREFARLDILRAGSGFVVNDELVVSARVRRLALSRN